MKPALLTIFVLLALVAMASVGIAHIVKPDWFVKRSGVRKGGTFLTEWSRLNFQLFGAIVAAGAIYLLYRLLKQ